MRRLRTRGRTAPLCLAAALALSLAPTASLAQDATQAPGELDDGQTPSEEIAAETERQLDRQRREREEQAERDPIAPGESSNEPLDSSATDSTATESTATDSTAMVEDLVEPPDYASAL